MYYALERLVGPHSANLIKPPKEEIRFRQDLPSLPVWHTPRWTARLSDLSKGVFGHLNEEHKLGFINPNWGLEGLRAGRLWAMTLHYHKWLFTLAELSVTGDEESERAMALFEHYLQDWLARYASGMKDASNFAWNSYAVATRISWWVSSHDLLASAKRMLDPDLQKSFLETLWNQAAYLSCHLEYDLRGNHLLRDALGLAYAGRFLQGSQPRRWLETATTLALDQCREQVLRDGGHFERSVMYHVDAMEDILTLSILTEDKQASSELKKTWLRMANFLAWARHPDGMIPLFNDSALNGSCTPEQMLTSGMLVDCRVNPSPKRGGKLFPDYGLVCWHDDVWTIFFDVGCVGVDYQPGHCHADTLSIEVSYKGQRLFVDPGTWGYDLDDRRNYDRSTRSHNTVCVDGLDSSEVWHIFRCGRRAYPESVEVRERSNGFTASAGHTGYRHLPGGPRPWREVTLHGDQRLVIRDRCDGEGAHRLSGGWLLGPGWEVKPSDGGWRVYRPELGALNIRVQGPPGIKLDLSPRWYHPEFEMEMVTRRLAWTVETELPAEITTVHEAE